jgi:hypothetical protein
MKLTERLLEEAMKSIRQGFAWSYLGAVCMIFLAGVLVVSAPSVVANTKPTEVPAKVIAHLALQEAPGSEMLLQTKEDKHYLYVQKASKQGFTVIDVTKPKLPSLVNRSAPSNDATAGRLEMVSPDVALAEVPEKNSKGKVLKTFTSVTSILQDPSRGLIYLANNEGLWILDHPRPGLTPAKTKRPCGSEDAIASMPPDCQ